MMVAFYYSGSIDSEYRRLYEYLHPGKPARMFSENSIRIRVKEWTMARKVLLVIIASGLIFVSLTASRLAAQSLGPGPKLSVLVSSHPIPSHPQYAKLDAVYFQELIPQRSNGRIEVRGRTWSEIGLTGYEIIRLTRGGVIDIGNSPLAYIAQDVPLFDAADLPGLNPTVEQARRVFNALVPIANEELKRFNTRIIGSNPYPAQIVFCRHPLAGLADLKGRRVRTFGNALQSLVAAVGGIPVSIAYAETYTALERGVVDCAITGSSSGNAAHWHEVTTHQYTMPLGWAVSGYYANLEWWNKLPPDARTFLAATWRELEDRQWQFGGVELTQDGIDCNSGRPECKIGKRAKRPMVEVRPTESDRVRLREILTEVVIPNWVKQCGPRCGEIYNSVIAPLSGIRYVPR